MQDTEDEMSTSVCLSVCVCVPMWISLLYDVCSEAKIFVDSLSLMKEVKRWGSLQVDIIIGPL